MKTTLHQIPGKGYVLLMGELTILDYDGNMGYFPCVCTFPSVSRNEAYRRGGQLRTSLRRQSEEEDNAQGAREAAAEVAANPYNWAIVP